MKKIIVLLFLIASFTYGDSIWKLEEKAPLTLDTQVLSPDKLSSAILYSSTSHTDEAEMAQQYLKISTLNRSWWLSTIEPGATTINKIVFIDNSNLLIVQNSFTVDSSSVLNLETNKRAILGGGNAEYIVKGKNKGLFLLSDKKGYFPEGGAYWFDMLVNKNGDLIEVVSKRANDGGCIPLKSILSIELDYPKLRPSLSECVYVDR